MKAIGIITVTLVTMVLSALLNGWAFSLLWEWFVAPLGYPVLSIAQAIGLSMTIAYATHQYQRDENKDKPFTEVLAWGISLAIVKPLISLGVGLIIKSFL
jgi:hypothetical protein